MNYKVGIERLATVVLAVMMFIIFTRGRVSYSDVESFIYSNTSALRPILIGLSVGLPVACLGWVIDGFRE
jgi:hypothetical protein